MKNLIIYLLFGLFLYSCNDDGRTDYCHNRGTICDGYGYDYYKCEQFDPHFNRYHVWYEVWDENKWKVWYSYDIMYRNYCE